jgi:lycopene cyclase
MKPKFSDLAILGGGLSGAMIAMALAEQRPGLSITIIESGERLGGDHVWSFFASDVPAGGEALVEPMIAARWDGYSVHFPGRSRRLATPYRSVTSDRLDAAVRAVLPQDSILTGARVVDAGPTHAGLADGRRIEAAGVIDARGTSGLPHLKGGWQKFMGQTLQLSAPHGLTEPIVMDARVAQIDGYRFVYCLPFSSTEIFVEDTYYSDGPALDLPELRSRIAAYAADMQWQVAEISYEETGVLPVIANGNFSAFWRGGLGGPARVGARAAMVHPLTSYSLPDAVRFALHIAALDNLSAASLEGASNAWAANHWRRGSFYRMLSRMLFGASAPDARWRILERFYGLPGPLIERFYAGQSTLADKARILAGKPPVPITAALASLAGRGRPLADLGITRSDQLR